MSLPCSEYVCKCVSELLYIVSTWLYHSGVCWPVVWCLGMVNANICCTFYIRRCQRSSVYFLKVCLQFAPCELWCILVRNHWHVIFSVFVLNAVSHTLEAELWVGQWTVNVQSLSYCSVSWCYSRVMLFAVCRLFYVGSREGHMPGILSSIQVTRHTPAPAVILTVCLPCWCMLTVNVFVNVLMMVMKSLYTDGPSIQCIKISGCVVLCESFENKWIKQIIRKQRVVVVLFGSIKN